jgi:putative hydrolase of the HAD superfamily
MIQHISFDVWGTLISANKDFALARTALLSERFGLSAEHARHAYKTFKKRIEREAESFATAYSTDALISSFLFEIEQSPSKAVVSKLRNDLASLFLKHPPSVLDCNLELVQDLISRGLTLSIGSNSNFISGETMYPWIQNKFNQAFSFGVFSDLEHVSKPGQVFFGKVFARANKIRPVDWTNILHVGDNRACDLVGPSHVGMQSKLISNPSELSSTLTPLFL